MRKEEKRLKCSDEDRKRTSGGVFVAIDSNLGAVVGAEEGTIESIPGSEGRIAQAWANVREGLYLLGVLLALGRMDTEKTKPSWKRC